MADEPEKPIIPMRPVDVTDYLDRPDPEYEDEDEDEAEDDSK